MTWEVTVADFGELPSGEQKVLSPLATFVHRLFWKEKKNAVQ